MDGFVRRRGKPFRASEASGKIVWRSNLRFFLEDARHGLGGDKVDK